MLLMYMAEELPPTEQAEMRKRLAADPALQRELDELQNVQARFEQEMGELDHAEPLVGQASAIARVTRAMRQHQVNRTAVEYKLPARTRHVSLWHRVPRWTYPIAAAAAVGLIYVGVWTFRSDASRTLVKDTSTTNPSGPITDGDLADATTPDDVEQNFRNSNRTQTAELQQLRQVERQVADLSANNSDLLDGLLSQHVGMPDNE
jgi:hypothetical protein